MMESECREILLNERIIKDGKGQSSMQVLFNFVRLS